MVGALLKALSIILIVIVLLFLLSLVGFKIYIKRDEKDLNRQFGALKKAEDAILLDSTNLTIEEVLDKAVLLIEERREK